MQYNEEAVSGKSNVINYPNESGSRRYNANDKLVREAFKAGKGIYDGLPPLEDGQVIIDVVDGTPLFALSSDKSYGQKAVEKGIEIVAGNIPYLKYFASAASWAKELQLEGYFEFHPDTILEKGDIVIYYQSPEDVRGNGTTYAFRGNELLYIESWGYNDRSVEFGPNYMKYAEQYKKDIITIIADAVFWDVVGGKLGDSAKKIYGKLKK